MAFRDIKAGGAYVELMLRDKKFRDRLAAAGQKLRGFARGAAKAGAVMAGAAASGVAFGTRQFIKLGDELDKMSKRLGETVEGLSELRFAAQATGIEFEDIIGAAEELNIRLGEAAREGTGPLAETFQRLGLDARQLIALPLAERLEVIGEALRGISDNAQRQFAADEIFGGDAFKILPLLTSDIEALRQEARELGMTMTTESAQGAARLSQSLNVLSKQASFFAIEVGSMAAPLIERVIPTAQAYAQEMRRVFAFVSEFASTTTGGLMDFLQRAYVGTFSRITFAVTRWQQLWEMAITSAQLTAVRFGNQTVHLFGTVVPEWLRWFGENWRDVFTDVVNFTGTVASNIWENLKNLFEAIQGLFRGEGFNFEFTALTEGFESAIKELPEIAAREIGPMERQLQEQLNGLADGLVRDFEVHRHDFEAALGEFFPSRIEAPGRPRAEFDGEGIGAQMDQSRNRIFSTFNAAAAIAQGQGAGRDDKLLRELEDGKRARNEWDRRIVEAIEKNLAAT